MTRLLALFPALLAFASFATWAADPRVQSPGVTLGETVPPLVMPSRSALTVPVPARGFRAPQFGAASALSLGSSVLKATGEALEPGGPQWVATVRAAPAPYRVGTWRSVPGGYVARFQVDAEGAQGLRVRLDLGTMPGTMEVRAAGDDGRVHAMTLDPRAGVEAWTPWTDGAAQTVEIFSTVRPSGEAITVGALLHFDVPAEPKAAASCTLSTLCSSNNATLDLAILEAKRSIMRIQMVSGGSGFVCSATLINTPRFPAAYVVTANHCVSTQQVAGSITSRWFYETSACGATDVLGFEQVSGGMQLAFTNFHVDGSLLLMNNPPPPGAVYSAFNTGLLAVNSSVVSLSHPAGDAARLALGTYTGLDSATISGTGTFPQRMYRTIFSRGATEGGSSGSGLFVINAEGVLELRGTLMGGSSGDTCGAVKDAIYGRSDVFGANIGPLIALGSIPADDAPNQASALISAPLDPVADAPLNLATGPRRLLNKTITPGDIDVYRVVLSAQGTITASTEGGADLVGSLLNGQGAPIRANDDAEVSTLDFGLTRKLPAGTYYVQIEHFEPTASATYNLKLESYNVYDNYTDLWWNAAESGWGVNINHQGNILFATLFTYDTDGTPMWLVMSGGIRQSDGTYLGELYRTTGPAFNAPWVPSVPTSVGTMRLAFGLPTEGTLTYTVNGTTVTKSITRQPFGTQPVCDWSSFDRSTAFNFTDLWYSAAEPGWGVNVAHKGAIAFATIFTYGPTGKGAWYVMSNGARAADGKTFTGELYRTSGPAFSANPWTATTAVAVGTMTLAFSPGQSFDANTGTLTYSVDGVTVTKAINRQVFSQPKTECRAP